MVEISTEQLIGQVDEATTASTPLQRVELAAAGSARLVAVADDLVGHYVAAARAAGTPWTEIGAALGVTKQAAQQRHVARSSPGAGRLSGFDAGARDAVHRAYEEAAALQHRFVGTEHLLLGVLGLGEGTVADTLAGVGVTLEDARREALAVVGRGESPFAGEFLGLTARAEKVLELAARESRDRGADEVSSEDVVLGLIGEGRGVAAVVLVTLAGDLTAVGDALR